MKLRQIIFWLHLAAGVVAGVVILLMAVTGVLLAFERQIIAFAEREARRVEPPSASAPRLSLETIVVKAQESAPDGTCTAITLSADAATAAMVNFGRQHTVFVDPNTGAVLGHGASAVRSFFHVVMDWHGWVGTQGEHRDIGRAVTGVCNAAFVALVVSGFYLWWPRRWTRPALRAVIVPSLTLQGQPRNWNWHNAIGFWSAPVLLLITLTGLMISYQWAGNLLYTLTGSEPPPLQRPITRSPIDPETGRGRTASAAEGGLLTGRTGLDALLATTVKQVPHWRLITMRLPQGGMAQMTVMIEEADSVHPYPRTSLTLDTLTAAVVKWEPFANYNRGRTLRSWVRPVHTGEAGGVIGQMVAALASAGAILLVYSGLALACRRCWHYVGRRRRASGSASEAADQATRHRAP